MQKYKLKKTLKNNVSKSNNKKSTLSKKISKKDTLEITNKRNIRRTSKTRRTRKKNVYVNKGGNKPNISKSFAKVSKALQKPIKYSLSTFSKTKKNGKSETPNETLDLPNVIKLGSKYNYAYEEIYSILYNIYLIYIYYFIYYFVTLIKLENEQSEYDKLYKYAYYMLNKFLDYFKENINDIMHYFFNKTINETQKNNWVNSLENVFIAQENNSTTIVDNEYLFQKNETQLNNTQINLKVREIMMRLRKEQKHQPILSALTIDNKSTLDAYKSFVSNYLDASNEVIFPPPEQFATATRPNSFITVTNNEARHLQNLQNLQKPFNLQSLQANGLNYSINNTSLPPLPSLSENTHKPLKLTSFRNNNNNTSNTSI